ncbi:MAG: hypothetical protein HQ581_28125 [Planctomycetes bacterium]|nr:hypothetical protein [Planctomycetota bacterium]
MRTLIAMLAIGLLFAYAGPAAAECGGCGQQHDCCGSCGVQKTCQVVCEMKTVTKSCWVVECEEFCVPEPGCGSLKAGLRGDRAAGGCAAGESGGCGGCGEDPCASLQKPMVPPRCGKVRTRKTLVKKDITCEVPVYKCVVVCGNADCGTGCGTGDVEEEAPLVEPTPATTTDAAPLPPMMDTSNWQALRQGR